ncbi:MAG TPA: hypothetical protein DCY13_10720 [Verrucomicrobiales bacterium]|nr:hypothetical protein [Verrucomicrobiales bacterium]
MSAVSEAIVREYFETHGFLVRQQRKFLAPTKEEDEQIDFFVFNPHTDGQSSLPFELGPREMEAIHRAVIVVRAWHTEKFSAAVLANSPEMFRFLEPDSMRKIEAEFGSEKPFVKILVVPALPHAPEAREEAIRYLKSKGVDAVLPFRTMLADLIDHIETNRNYSRSDLLQMLRILKNYEFFPGPQLELFRTGRSQRKSRPTE